MITKLDIKNFKIHKSTTLGLKLLNVLAGKNSSGKSSIIQALLLLRQSYLSGELQNGLQLQGNLCNIGLIDDAICESAGEDAVEFQLVINGEPMKWVFSRKSMDSFQNMIPSDKGNSTPTDRHSLFTNNFQYIGAARLAPQESYPIDTSAVEIKKQLSKEL